MPEFTYEHEPDAPFADAGQPLFFRRRYGGDPEPPHREGSLVHVSMEPARPVWIYGYSIRLTGEDWASCRDVWQRRMAFYAYHYSVMEPRGEPGFVRITDVEPITREQFEYAAAEGWPVP
jgi:hypothetical protein